MSYKKIISNCNGKPHGFKTPNEADIKCIRQRTTLWPPVLFWYRYKGEAGRGGDSHTLCIYTKSFYLFESVRTRTASLACILHTVVSTPGSEDTQTLLLWTHISHSVWYKGEGNGIHCLPSGCRRLQPAWTCCSGGGGAKSPLSAERGPPCPRGGRPLRGAGVPGHPGAGRRRLPHEAPQPGVRGPEAPPVRPSACRTRGRPGSRAEPETRAESETRAEPEAPAAPKAVPREPWGSVPPLVLPFVFSSPPSPPQEASAGLRGVDQACRPRAHTGGPRRASREERSPRLGGPTKPRARRGAGGPGEDPGRGHPRAGADSPPSLCAPRPPHPLLFPGINSGRWFFTIAAV